MSDSDNPVNFVFAKLAQIIFDNNGKLSPPQTAEALGIVVAKMIVLENEVTRLREKIEPTHRHTTS